MKGFPVQILHALWLMLFLLAVAPFRSAAEPLRIVRAAAPPEGLLALPLLRMTGTQPLLDQGMRIEFVPWSNQEQLRAVVLSGRADVVSLHTVGAAVMHSRGVPLRMLGLSMGNVLHVLTSHPDIRSLSDLQGMTVAVPFKGELPDILFRTLLNKSAAVPPGSVHIRYASSSRDSANLLAGGRVEAALVAEPHSSILLQKAGRDGIPELFDSVDLQQAWNQLCGSEMPLPAAGVAALGEFSGNEPQLESFWQAYAEAVHWCMQHPEKAAGLSVSSGETAAVQGAVRAIQTSLIAPVTACAAHEWIERFIAVFREADPAGYGDLHPEDSFFWPDHHSVESE
jgi:NitT/TauT family transport system substrate-binding protein